MSDMAIGVLVAYLAGAALGVVFIWLFTGPPKYDWRVRPPINRGKAAAPNSAQEAVDPSLEQDYKNAKHNVMRVLYPHITGVPWADTWQLDEHRATHAKYVAWVASTEMEPCFKRAYAEWLVYYESQINRRAEELLSKSKESKHEEFMSKLRRDLVESSEFDRTRPTPTPRPKVGL